MERGGGDCWYRRGSSFNGVNEPRCSSTHQTPLCPLQCRQCAMAMHFALSGRLHVWRGHAQSSSAPRQWSQCRLAGLGVHSVLPLGGQPTSHAQRPSRPRQWVQWRLARQVTPGGRGQPALQAPAAQATREDFGRGAGGATGGSVKEKVMRGGCLGEAPRPNSDSKKLGAASSTSSARRLRAWQMAQKRRRALLSSPSSFGDQHTHMS